MRLNSMIFNYIFIISITNLLIFSFYYHFKTNWPEEYFGKDDKLALAISVSFRRLILFRILPIFIICFLVFSYVDLDIDSYSWLILGISTTLFYGLFTSGISIIKILLDFSTINIFANRPTQIFYHVISIISLAIIGIVVGGILVINPFKYLNTSVRSLVDNITAAVLYSLIIIPGYRMYRHHVDDSYTNIDTIIQKSIIEIREDKKLFKQIVHISKKENANIDLVLAFCVVENIQRPRWFRLIENLIPFKSTRGIMQVQANKRISDNDSIKLAIKRYLSNTNDITVDEPYLNRLVASYNGKISEKYLLLIERALYNINYEWYQKIVTPST